MVRVCYSLIILIQVLLGGALSIQHASHKIPHQENLALKQLLTRTKEAAGGSRWDRIHAVSIKWRALEGGLNGVVQENDDLVGVRYMDISDFGVRSGAYGFNRKIVWSQDSSGLAQTEEGADAREGTINEAYRRSLAYWYPERWGAQVEYEGQKQDGALRFHVLKITPEGGRPFELWFDGTTYLLTRIVEKTATGILSVWLEDYREIDNLKVPFLVRVRLPSGGENVYRAEKVEFNVRLPDTRFDIPPPPPPDFLLMGNVSSVTLPMDMINNHIYVSGKLNEHGPYRFLVDTGWGTSSITPQVARSLGLSTQGAQKTMGAGEGTAENAFTKVAKMQFGRVQLLNQSLLVTSAFDGKTRDAVGDFGGLLGYELFKRFVVSLDFERKTLTLTLPSRFAYRGEGTIVPFKLSNTIPLVRGEVDGIHGEFIVDSGFPGSVILYQNFVAKNDLATKLKPKFETITGWGIGGPVRAGVTRVRIFKVGEVTASDSVVTLSLLKAGTLGDPHLAGAIGSEMLKRFNVTFDYSRREMIFVRNVNYGKPEVFDRSGMYLNKGPGWFDVVDVVASGPADEAGIRIGDRILSIDGKGANKLSLPEVRLKFKGPVNTRIKVITKRGQSATHAMLVLRDLI
jgi:hypothetical protein